MNLTKEYYVIALDFDGWDAVEKWFGTWDRVVSLSKKQIVEWHGDKGKIHVILLSQMPLPNKKIHLGNAYLEIRCDKQPLFVSPSIHKEGNPYCPLTDELFHPQLLTNEDALRLKSKIENLCESYMSDTDKEKYEKWLDDPTTILGENRGRHDATKFKIIRNYWKYGGNGWLNYTDEQRFDDAWQWHFNHCKPSRTRDEFDRLCEWVRNNHRAKRDEYFEKVRDQKQSQSQADSDIKSLPSEIRDKLSTNVFSLIGRNPLRLYVADSITKEIMKVVIAWPKDVTETSKSGNTTTTTTTKTTTIKYTEKDTIIDAIPIKVTINENPLDGTKTYQVTFQHKGSRPFTLGPGNIAYLIEQLQTKGRYVSEREAKQALTGILVKYEDTPGMAQKTEKPLQYGYFWINNKMVGYDTTQEDIEPRTDVDRRKVLDCVDVLEMFYQRSKHKFAFVTVVKWSTVSPFSYAKKFVNKSGSSGNWIPDLQPHGETQTGKTTLSRVALAVWRLHTNQYLRIHEIGFAEADTKAKHGHAVSQTTYPVTIHEVGQLAHPDYYPRRRTGKEQS